MLSEDAKTCIRFIALPDKENDEAMGSAWIAKGNSPRDFIPFVVEFCRDFENESGDEMASNLEANLEEAGQYLAGLLGLM